MTSASDVLEALIELIRTEEEIAAAILKDYQKDKGFDLAKNFAKNQAETTLLITRNLRSIVKDFDIQMGDPTCQAYYPENQPSIEEASNV